MFIGPLYYGQYKLNVIDHENILIIGKIILVPNKIAHYFGIKWDLEANIQWVEELHPQQTINNVKRTRDVLQYILGHYL